MSDITKVILNTQKALTSELEPLAKELAKLDGIARRLHAEVKDALLKGNQAAKNYDDVKKTIKKAQSAE